MSREGDLLRTHIRKKNEREDFFLEKKIQIDNKRNYSSYFHMFLCCWIEKLFVLKKKKGYKQAMQVIQSKKKTGDKGKEKEKGNI